MHNVFIILEYRYTLLHVRAFLAQKERGTNQQFINCTMDHLSVFEYVIKKGRHHGHRHGKKPRDKEYLYGLPTPIEEEMQKDGLQGNP